MSKPENLLKSFPEQLPPLVDSASFLVIGSGIAGLYAALELSQTGRVLVLTKAEPIESNTAYAQGGIAAALGPQDSPELHYQDTIMAGAGLSDPEAVLTLVHEGPNRIQRLLELGVAFDRTPEGGLAFTREAAHSRSRVLHANGDATGRAIASALVAQVRQTPQIQIYPDHFALALVTEAGRCCGVVTLNQGKLGLFLGAEVLLATGGLGQLYGKTTNPAIATGDGMALAANCGACLRDLEFLQFHPTALHLPQAPPFLISEAVRGEGAILLNSQGHRFMPDYHPLAELAPRDVVARAIFAEIKQSDQSFVMLDLARIPDATIKRRFPNIYETCRQYGLEITSDPIPVAPAAHYIMGGVGTDFWGRTSIPGLSAAGEVACTGVHGANRLASNSLLEGLVFGGRAAADLANLSCTVPKPSKHLTVHFPSLYTTYQKRTEDLRFLHEITDAYLGIVRDGPGLTQAREQLRARHSPSEEFALNPAYFELQNLYSLAALMLTAALTRTESRGGHFRSDYPAPVTDWRKHINFCNFQLEVEE